VRGLGRGCLVVVLCLGQVVLVGSGVVADGSDDGGRAPEGGNALDPEGGLVDGSGSDASSEAAGSCAQTFNNGTPGDLLDDYKLTGYSVASNGDRSCVYVRVVVSSCSGRRGCGMSEYPAGRFCAERSDK